MDKKLLEEIKGFGADPYFVRFIIALSGVTHRDEVDFMVENVPEAQQKKMKRALQKHYPKKWEQLWKEKKEQKHLKLESRLFSKTPLPPKSKGRPRKDHVWIAIQFLRDYFIKLTSKPNMKLIAKIVGMAYSNILTGWKEREGTIPRSILPGSPVEMTVEFLLQWYDSQKDSIREALDTNTPLRDIIEKKGNRKVN